ncbi:hypothetical protein F2Q70_00030796 [Brassica cretica]|uniref:X8 domain-containing protein n=1 Tax=Brassica cretica TaxID=69181 RepID=A0A8S9FC47_BRACR|nr:hypothetical protein F2Q70_00030796 [Brassica cretica]
MGENEAKTTNPSSSSVYVTVLPYQSNSAASHVFSFGWLCIGSNCHDYPLCYCWIMTPNLDGDDQALQKVIDYACGSGADCSQIEQNGPCFQPNTVKNHCDVAVNSFYQKKASTGATCDFNGAAVVSTSPPSNASSCLSSSGSTSTPTTGTPSTGNLTTGSPSTRTPSTGNSTFGMPTNVNPTTGVPTSSVFPGTTMGPSGSTGFDPSCGDDLSVQTATVIVLTTIAVVALRV